MNIKVELGNKIRELREEKGLSRGELCGGEEELTVRQLARIEAGESLPTLPKLEFIAERLAVSVPVLIDKKHVELPKRYLQLKIQICKFFTYKEEERIAKKERLFNEVYEVYYDDLPEDEQLAIDVQRVSTDVALSDNVAFGEGILGEYFSQVLHKKDYAVNDLLIIELYLLYIHYKDYDEEVFLKLFQNLSTQSDYSVNIEQFLLIRLMMVSVGVFMEHNNYHKIIDAVGVANTIMKINQEFQQKPAIDMYEGKYWLFAQKDKEKAKKKYMEGSKFAEMMGSSLLSEKIMKEWEDDLLVFEQQQSSV